MRAYLGNAKPSAPSVEVLSCFPDLSSFCEVLCFLALVFALALTCTVRW